MSKNSEQNGNHAVKRRVRMDRVAVVVIPLLLIIILIVFLCLSSCEQEDDTETEVASDSVTDTEISTDEETEAEAAAEDTTEEEEVDTATSVTFPETVSEGDLILINEDNLYDFSEGEDNLVYVYEHVNSSYSVSDWEMRLDADTVTQVNAMMEAYEAATGYSNLEIFSGYRTSEEQAELYEAGSTTFPGGTSDFHSGRTFNLKINFTDGSSDYYNTEKYPDYVWIEENAASYGFIVRYPEGKEDLTGETSRAYTYRYVGVPHATYMYENDLCLEEYLELVQEYTQDATLDITVDDTVYHVFYVSASDAEEGVELDASWYSVSGDNMDGYVIAYLDLDA